MYEVVTVTQGKDQRSGDSTSQSKYLLNYSAFEALLKSMEIPEDSPLWGEMKRTCGFDRLSTQYHYPLRMYMCMVDLLRQRFYAELPLDEALFSMAQKQSATYVTDTILGRVGYAARGRVKHSKFLETFLRNYNMQFTFGTRTVTHIDPGHSRITFEDDPSDPRYVRGTLHTVLELNNASGIRVEVRSAGTHSAIYDLYWNDEGSSA